MLGVDVVHPGVGHPVEHGLSASSRRGDEVPLDLGLAVDDGAAPGQLLEVDEDVLLGPAEVDAAVLPTLAVQPVAEAGTGEDVDRGLFQDAGPDPGRDVGR